MGCAVPDYGAEVTSVAHADEADHASTASNANFASAAQEAQTAVSATNADTATKALSVKILNDNVFINKYLVETSSYEAHVDITVNGYIPIAVVGVNTRNAYNVINYGISQNETGLPRSLQNYNLKPGGQNNTKHYFNIFLTSPGMQVNDDYVDFQILYISAA